MAGRDRRPRAPRRGHRGDRRAPGPALRLRPGQFASIETPYRPRSWRTYSMATAPSADGLLEFHVRAVGAGWVSGPLVWRAQVGDVLRLGAPMGEMRIDQQSRRDILWSPAAPAWRRSRRWSTGWPLEHRAPGHAVLRRPPGRRPLRHGRAAPAGRDEPWLTVVPVVSDEPSFDGEQGTAARRGRALRHVERPRRLRVRLARHDAGHREPADVAGRPRRPDVVRRGRRQHPAAAQVIDLRRTRASRAAR